jgi:hypothetical protein
MQTIYWRKYLKILKEFGEIGILGKKTNCFITYSRIPTCVKRITGGMQKVFETKTKQ